MSSRQLTIILTAAALVPIAASPAVHATSSRPAAQFLWGFVSPGEDPSEMGKEGVDDVGPPRSARDKWLAQAGVSFRSVTAHWQDAEPQRLPDSARGADFNWKAFDAALEAIPSGKASHCTFKLDARWAQDLKARDQAAYWRLAERFIELAAQRARAHGIRYYGVPGNEMSLTGRPDWAELYMEPVRHYAQAIHRAASDNQVIAGALVCGSRDLIDELYKHGFKENCDVLDIHAYAGSPGEDRFHVGLSQVLEAHQALVDHGDGHKRIFLGEGWSVFPLPAHLDRLTQPPTYTKDDAEHYRKALVYGYAALTTPRPDYDPTWILGARFFCLNDLWGSMGWKKRATIERNKDGDPQYWLLDGYRVPYSPDAMDPQFRAWGLIDITGKPKGDVLEHFPPYVPRCSVTAELAGSSDETIYPGLPYRLRVSTVNREDQPITNLRFSVDAFEGLGRKDLSVKALTGKAAGRLQPRCSERREFEVTLRPSVAGRTIRIQGGCEYDWQGQSYYSDGWLKLRIASPGTFELKPFEPLPEQPSLPVTLTFVLTDQTGRVLPSELEINASDRLILRQRSQTTGPRTRQYTVLAEAKDRSAGGFFTLEAKAGAAFAPFRADIAFPRSGHKPERLPPRGHLVNPGFEEFGPGSGFEGWDGPPSNIDDPAMAADLPDHGSRMIETVYNETRYSAENSQTVLTPAGWGSGGTVEASVWTKGMAFVKAADHSALRFRISVAFLDAAGNHLRRDDSPFLAGTGNWERLSFRTGAAPSGTAAVRLILIHENTNARSWHKAAMDNAGLEFRQGPAGKG